MKQDEQFDELARRKLEDRSFPFEEADWLAARALIDARSGRSGGVAWPFWALLVLLLAGGLTWYILADGDRSGQSDPAVATIATVAPSPALPGSDLTDEGVMVTEAETKNDELTVEAIEMKDLPEEAGVAIAPSVLPPAAGTTALEPQEPAARAPEASSTDHSLAWTPEPTREAEEASFHTSDATTEAIPDAGEHVPSIRTTNEEPEAEQPVVARPGWSQTEAIANSNEEPTAPNQAPQPIVEAQPIAPRPTHSGDTLTTRAADNRMVPPTDSTSFASVTATVPEDSLASVELLLPLIPERAPWEISLLGGVFNSHSVYRGGNSTEWAQGSSSAMSPAFGAELMHMGPHIGLGVGLHWGSYAERLRTDARQETFTYLNQQWTFTSFDTTILVITDTLPGTPPSFHGTTVDTTLSVFISVTDTLTEERTVRDAREQENRVSYLEVPLLADVHLVQGRWTLGLRGGPSIGLLMGRRGALPNATGDGYIPYGEQSFRRLMIGYTARAYVRYRFNAGWSVGLEPALRGQLLNSMDNGTIDKRSHAVGLMMGLTYRFR